MSNDRDMNDTTPSGVSVVDKPQEPSADGVVNETEQVTQNATQQPQSAAVVSTVSQGVPGTAVDPTTDSIQAVLEKIREMESKRTGDDKADRHLVRTPREKFFNSFISEHHDLHDSVVIGLASEHQAFRDFLLKQRVSEAQKHTDGSIGTPDEPIKVTEFRKLLKEIYRLKQGTPDMPLDEVKLPSDYLKKIRDMKHGENVKHKGEIGLHVPQQDNATLPTTISGTETNDISAKGVENLHVEEDAQITIGQDEHDGTSSVSAFHEQSHLNEPAVTTSDQISGGSDVSLPDNVNKALAAYEASFNTNPDLAKAMKERAEAKVSEKLGNQTRKGYAILERTALAAVYAVSGGNTQDEVALDNTEATYSPVSSQTGEVPGGPDEQVQKINEAVSVGESASLSSLPEPSAPEVSPTPTVIEESVSSQNVIAAEPTVTSPETTPSSTEQGNVIAPESDTDTAVLSSSPFPNADQSVSPSGLSSDTSSTTVTEPTATTASPEGLSAVPTPDVNTSGLPQEAQKETTAPAPTEAPLLADQMAVEAQTPQTVQTPQSGDTSAVNTEANPAQEAPIENSDTTVNNQSNETTDQPKKKGFFRRFFGG